MGQQRTAEVLHGLTRLADAPISDSELLGRFAATRDESAFAALTERYGGLVYGTCRNLLRHEHDAEDAFQATFLVLAQRAGSIHQGEALGGWLYRVAYRVSLRVRRSAERRRQREERVAKPDETRPPGELAWRELQGMLDEELNRLPEKYRVPFVLCCLTGRSKAEAAAELGWKEGTVSSRLAQARERLRVRLARRGVALSAILSGLALSPGGSAGVPAALMNATRSIFTTRPIGVPAAAAQAVVRSMTFGRLKIPVALVLLLGLGLGAIAALRKPADPESTTPISAPAVAVVPAEVAPTNTMSVSGSVVGPGGQIVPDARVAVVVSRNPEIGDLPIMGNIDQVRLGDGAADRKGEFKLNVPQTTHSNFRLTAVAWAPGFALTSETILDPTIVSKNEHAIPLELVRGFKVRGRFVDRDGTPIPKLQARIAGLVRAGWTGSNLIFHDPPNAAIPGWPADVTSDANGDFSIPDIGPITQIVFQIRDERYSPQWLGLVTGNAMQAEPHLIRVAPLRELEGRLVAADTKEPIAGATILAEVGTAPALPGHVVGKTDAQGKFVVRPFPGAVVRVNVIPPTGSPFLASIQETTFAIGTLNHNVELESPRGVLIRGTVREADNLKPVAGADIQYHWSSTVNSKLQLAQTGSWPTPSMRTGEDGSFVIAVWPGRGGLIAKAREPDFIHVETSVGELTGTTPGIPIFPDAIARLDLKRNESPRQVNLEFRRGVTRSGVVKQSNGQPVRQGVLFSPTYIGTGDEVKGHPIRVRNGMFELPGCDPTAKIPVYVFDPDSKEGAVATLSASETEIRLAPSVSAVFRPVDAKGKSVPAPKAEMFILLRNGFNPFDVATPRTENRPWLSMEIERAVGQPYAPKRVADGEYEFDRLIPGATYSLRFAKDGYFTAPITFAVPKTGRFDLGKVVIKSNAPPGFASIDQDEPVIEVKPKKK